MTNEWQPIDTAPDEYPFVVGKWDTVQYGTELHWFQVVARGKKWADYFHGAAHWRKYPDPPQTN